MVKSLARRRQLAREKWERQQRRRRESQRRSRRRALITGAVLLVLMVIAAGALVTFWLWPDGNGEADQNNGLDIVEHVTEAGSQPGVSTAGLSHSTTVITTDIW